MLINFIKHKILKFIIVSLEILAVCLVFYLVVLPFYPSLKYKYYSAKAENSEIDYKNINDVKKATEKIIKQSAISNSPQKGFINKASQAFAKISSKIVPPKKKINNASNIKPAEKKGKANNISKAKQNRLIISKIGVNIPIVENKDEKIGLNKGAWRVSDSSTPDKGGNTVLTGHRFKYLPPSNLTFYLFNKLEKDDIVSVLWNGKTYYYRIKESRIVPATEVSVMKDTKDSILTMFTCDPVYSTKNRLVIKSDLIYENIN